MNTVTSRPEIVLGVSGGIAAYKACELLRLFTESGHGVTVVPTAAALRFVGEATWAALSGRPVATEVFDAVHEVPHVRLGRQADLVVVAPATADLLARAATGRADDLLTNILLTTRGPVLFAPAMHTEMWENPATADNVAVLRRRGHIVLEPAVGRLTGADTGKGRLPDPARIFEVAVRLLRRGPRAPDLTGRHVVVTAGGTREPLDPVRFIGNRSSGKQGHALARAASARGARVTLVSANVALPPPAGVDLVTVGTTAQLHEAVLAASETADVVVMAAAPADFRPASYRTEKIKKTTDTTGMTLELVPNADIAADLGSRKKPGRLLVAFAAETGNGLANARRKLTAKNADLVVLNEVGEDKAFGTDDNAVTLVRADGTTEAVPLADKDQIADRILDEVVSLLT
ncbi:phosphopantothenoylcysteine decarboxylase/phosphopantothenate--cysteine ligase [Stackebrandtia albiflava]|uniref:Coenzyme A biosynthesis bifunctional protein CoaBC n=1 Tax=Stackebrandtia albiflava TaxID=406432 RepID=A0A562VD33_9ACTN|nr:bifunctional phosphopantothenoylcysteine decarboxylase/phosphopantothenate--cysteine ligase CoaBC [Stackebrandtia albiflava]TWJ15758.1 phosphopantothenoylcysteine decarboxylase/phosphopantothenate--cysteine ligase [Stackebrandtia albiflava]